MRRLFLCDCEPGDTIEDVFVLTNKQFSSSQGGKPFIKAFVSDRTAQVTARMWNATKDMFNSLPEGGFVRIRAHIENYQGNLQFIIDQAWPAKEGTYEIADLIPHTSRDIKEMCGRIQEILGSIQNRHLSALIQAYQDDQELMERFCKAPAAQSYHHAFIGGLLEHTLNAIEVGDAVCKFYPGLNRDLVIAGIFLHDIGKTWELTYDCTFNYSDGGHLVGHIVKSAIWVEQRRTAAEQMLGEKIPQNLIDVLQHIILSHHGELSLGFGSAKSPATPEAIAVHVIENLDAKLMVALRATRGEAAASAEGNWTEYVKSLGGRLYRPDPAPAEAPVTEEVPETIKMPISPVNGDAQPPRKEKAPDDGQSAPMPLKLNNPMFEIMPTRK